jgi:tRNA dimethylallyltransferase
MDNLNRPIIAIVGPTASGKSDLGIALALKFGGEIINCDSVQVYQSIEIATAKVSLEERQGIPHHLIDFLPPHVTYTAAQWARDATLKIEEIESRGNMVFLVGGTGFYLRALRQPFFESPPTDWELRNRLTGIKDRRGLPFMHKMLKRLDPESALRLYERDWVRIQRAIEVSLQTKRPLSSQKSIRPDPPLFANRIEVIALSPTREVLYKRINERTENHYRAGLIDEVKDLLSKGVPPDSTALGAHGYRRVVEYLRGERPSIESAIEQTKLDIRHYAKRQLTWFRKEPGVKWFNGFGDDPRVQEEVAKYIERLIEDC